MDVNEMTRLDFMGIPQRDWNDNSIEFDSMIIIPGYAKDLHDSGYRCMDFVAVKNGEPICRLSGCSDVIHIDGIGGYGKNWYEKYGGVPKLVQRSGWSIDCLAKSGFLRIWPDSRKMTCGYALSSFEIYAEKKD